MAWPWREPHLEEGDEFHQAVVQFRRISVSWILPPVWYGVGVPECVIGSKRRLRAAPWGEIAFSLLCQADV